MSDCVSECVSTCVSAWALVRWVGMWVGANCVVVVRRRRARGVALVRHGSSSSLNPPTSLTLPPLYKLQGMTKYGFAIDMWSVGCIFGELLQKSEDDLLAITNFGQKSLDEVIEKLDERGLSLRNRD